MHSHLLLHFRDLAPGPHQSSAAPLPDPFTSKSLSMNFIELIFFPPESFMHVGQTASWNHDNVGFEYIRIFKFPTYRALSFNAAVALEASVII